MQLKSTYTLHGAEDTGQVDIIPVAQSAPISIASAIALGAPYARFLQLITSSGGTHATPLTLVAYNANSFNGDFLATYSVTLEEDFLSGETITHLALSPDGTRALNPVAITPYLKQHLSLHISVHIDLSIHATGCILFGTDTNPLVRTLLGMDSFIERDCYAQWGTSIVRADLAATDTLHLTQNRIDATLTFVNDFPRFMCTLPQTARDVVLFIKEQPVLRVAVPTFIEESFVGMARSNSEQTIAANATTLVEVANITQPSNPLMVSQTEILSPPWRFIAPQSPLMLHFSPELTLLTDPSNRCAAFVSDTTLYFISTSRGRPAVRSTLDIVGAKVFLPYHNEVVLLYARYIEVYRYAAQTGFALVGKIPLSTTTNGRAEIAKRGEFYTVIREIGDGSQWERGFFNAQSYTWQETHNVTGAEIFYRNRYFLGMVTPNGHAFSWDRWGLDVVTSENLTHFMRGFTEVEIVGALDGLLHMRMNVGTQRFACIYSPFANQAHIVAVDSHFDLRGDYSTVRHANGSNQLMYYFRDTQNLGFITLSDMPTVAEVVRLDQFLLVRRQGGALEYYSIEPARFALYHPFMRTDTDTQFIAQGVRPNVTFGARRFTIEII